MPQASYFWQISRLTYDEYSYWKEEFFGQVS